MSSKTSSRSGIKVVQLKKGRRLYGAIYTLEDGRRAYVAYRKTTEIFRGGEKSISDAIRKGKATWAIDDETLLQVRAQGIPFVGVLVRDTKDLYMTTLDRFFDKRFYKILNYSGRNGSLQRHLPLTQFRYRSGKVRI